MDATLWAKLHGAATHFPLALAASSGALAATGCALGGRPVARDLHAAGYWMIIGGAVGSGPAVFSGLLMTKGNLFGHGALRMHHLFVWPAFAMVIALATWRALGGHGATRRAFGVYLLAVGLAAGLMLGAGYWGGEMMVAG